MQKLKLALVQHACSEDRAHNLETTLQGVRDAAAEGAQLVLLQELHGSRYFCQSEQSRFFDLAEPVPGPTTARFATLAKELAVVIVTSLFERRAAGIDERAVHLPLVVPEHPEPRQLVGDRLGVLDGVVVRDTDEAEEPAADLAHDRTVDGDRGVADPLDDDTHAASLRPIFTGTPEGRLLA